MMRAALVAAGFGLAVNAHLFIQSPTPIQGSAPKSPLESTGANFPCHGVSLPSSGGQSMAAGSSQLLKFDNGAQGENTAVHGGGSCQLSLTYETDGQKVKDPSNWHVIYSIEGGCPSNTHANLDGNFVGNKDPGAWQCDDSTHPTNGVDCINAFNFTIPKGVKSGHATLSWTWFNTVGNREIYQNCASVDLTGGDGSEMGSFPAMFVANMPSIDNGGKCPTTESVAVKFPNPGKYVTTKSASGPGAATAATFPMAVPTGSGCSGDGGSASGGSGSSPASYGSSSPSSASAAAPAYGSASAAQSASMSQATGGSGNAAVTVTTMATVTGAPYSAPAAASSYAAAPTNGRAGTGSSGSDSNPGSSGSSSNTSSSSNSSSSGSCANGAVSCSDPGAVVCIGSTQFGICDQNNCAVPQDLAAGTHCSGGTIAKRRHRHMVKHLAPRREFHA